jgi:putative transposase
VIHAFHREAQSAVDNLAIPTDGFQARKVVKNWMAFYNTERPHSALDRRTPDETYWTSLEQQKAA